MAITPTDWDIPSSQGILKNVYAIQGQQQQNALNSGAIAGQNMLRRMYQDPNALDPNTGTLKPQYVNMIGQVSPETAMTYMQDAQKLMQHRVATQAAGQKITDANREWVINTVAGPAYEAYRSAKEQTGDEEAARRAGQDVYNQGLETVKTSGRLTPQETAQLSPQFDPQRASYNLYGPKELERQREHTVEERRKAAEFERSGVDKPVNIEITAADGSKTKTTGVYDRDHRRWTTVDGQPIDGNVVEIGRSRAPETVHPSKEIAVVDKDGNVVDRFAAREGSALPEPGHSGMFRTDTGAEVKVPEGGHIDVGPGTAPIAGSRESVYQGRVLNSALDATTRLKAFTMMPTSVSSGAFGLGTEKVGLLDAPRAMLAQALSPTSVQQFNAMMAGMNRSMATIESSGLSPGYHFSEQFGALTLKPTDSLDTKLFKLADMRQIVENGMSVLLSNPRLSPEQKKLASKISDEVKKNIPWTIFDVLELQNAENPQETLKSLGTKRTGKEGETAAAAGGGSSAAPSVEDFAKTKAHELTDPQTGTKYHIKNGKVVVGPYVAGAP